LKDRRAALAGEIVRFKQDIRDREEQLTHLDATLRVLDPEYRADTIAPKRLRRVKLFGNGELNRLIIDALRRADGKAISTPAIADAIITAKGCGAEAKHALIRRVRANLSSLEAPERGREDRQPDDGQVAAVGAGKVALDAIANRDRLL
jgi:hypothetical protein